MPLPLDAFGRVRPRAGEVLVERDEQPERYGNLIILTESYRTKVKSAIGTVRAVGTGVAHLREGDRVLISAGVARSIAFGEGRERILYVCEPLQLYGLLLEDAQRIEELGESLAGRFPWVSERTIHARAGLADQGVEKGPPSGE